MIGSSVVYSAWPLEDAIVSQNLWHRDIYNEDGVNRYLFISSPGVDGIMFGFDATNTCREDGRIVAWFPDDTPVRTMADDFWSFFSGWETGEFERMTPDCADTDPMRPSRGGPWRVIGLEGCCDRPEWLAGHDWRRQAHWTSTRLLPPGTRRARRLRPLGGFRVLADESSGQNWLQRQLPPSYTSIGVAGFRKVREPSVRP